MDAARPATIDQVRQTCDRVIAAAHDSGTRPSVLAVARAVGLSNTTFRRQFPDIARELGQIRRAPAPPTSGSTTATKHADLQDRNARLARDNTTLTEHLELAIANIQRLTLENHQLRGQLEAAKKVTRIKPR